MFNMGFTEILFIAGLALILIGPKQLPEVARTLGRFLNELRRSTNVLKEEFKAQTEFDRQATFNKEYQNIIKPEVEPTSVETPVEAKEEEKKS